MGIEKVTNDWHVYFEKAREARRVAEYCYDQQAYNSCANRAYFAAFQMTISALIKLTTFRPTNGEWGHDIVQSQLNVQFVRNRKFISAELGRVLPDLIAIRTMADYEQRMVSEKSAVRALRKAKELMGALESIIGE